MPNQERYHLKKIKNDSITETKYWGYEKINKNKIKTFIKSFLKKFLNNFLLKKFNLSLVSNSIKDNLNLIVL